MGQYCHGNEPSHHVIYLLRYADRAARQAELVRDVFEKFYVNKPDGLCGNDDCGQMSAWYLFSARRDFVILSVLVLNPSVIFDILFQFSLGLCP